MPLNFLSNLLNLITMLDNYLVKYRFQNSNCQTTLTLHGESESEAIQKLIERGTIPEELADELIIYSVEKR